MMTGAEDLSESNLQDCLFNAKLSEDFRAFGKELGVEDARGLEDVYKFHLRKHVCLSALIFTLLYSQ